MTAAAAAAAERAVALAPPAVVAQAPRAGKHAAARHQQAGSPQWAGTADAGLAQLNGLVQGQSVMIATNQLMFTVALAFIVAAFAVWLAPRPSREVDAAAAGH